MPFRNDILGGEELIRSAIRSENFNDGSQDGAMVTGWRIGRDGSATFNNVTIGSPEWNIDSDGSAVFNEVSTDSITLDGESLSSIINVRGRGVLGVTNLSNETAPYAGSSIEFARVTIPNLEDREYRISLHNIWIDKKTSSPTWIRIDGYFAFGQVATESDFHLIAWQDGQNETSSSSDEIISFSTCFGIGEGGEGFDGHISLFFRSSTDGPTIRALETVSRIVTEDLGAAVDNLSEDMSNPGGSTGGGETQYTRTYDAVWSASWDAGDSRKMDAELLYQGDYSGSNDRYGKIGFDDTQIRSDLNGATIDQVELRLSNEHSWLNSGLDPAIIGTHNNTNEPTGSTSTSGNFNRFTYDWDKGQTKYVALTTAVGEEFRDNTSKGITTGRTNAGGQSDYGYFTGADGTNSSIPRLRITYTK